jgi:hypothetical protein
MRRDFEMEVILSGFEEDALFELHEEKLALTCI